MSDHAENILRKMFIDDCRHGGYFDIDNGVVDLHVDDLTDDEIAYLHRLREPIEAAADAEWVDVTDHVVDATITPGRPDA